MMLRIGILFVLLFHSLIHEGQGVVDSLKNVLDSIDNPEEQAITSIEVSKNLLRIDLTEAKKYAEQAVVYASDYDSLKIVATDQLAKTHFFRSQLDSALNFFNEARDLALERNLLDQAASIGISIGSVHLRQGLYDQAIHFLTSSAEYFEEQGNELNKAKCYSNISAAHDALGNSEKAIEYNTEALAIFKKYNISQLVLLALPNLATQYVSLGDTTKGIDFYLEAETMGLKLKNNRSLAVTYNNLGNIYLARNQFAKARSYLEKSLSLKNQIGLIKGVDLNYFNLGAIENKLGNPIKAITFFEEALKHADDATKAPTYLQLKEAYKKLNNNLQALHYAEEAQVLSDSLNKAENIRNFNEISEKYENEKQQKEIIELQYENDKLEFGRSRNKVFIMLLGIALLAGTIISYLFFKSQKRKEIIAKQKIKIEQQKTLEALKQKELETIDRIIAGQDKQRQEIAANLHDSIGSKLAVIKLHLDNLEEQVVSASTPVREVKDIMDMAYDEIRTLSHSMNAGVLSDKGLIPAIKNLSSFISKSNAIDIEVIDLEASGQLENNIELQLFRVIQELITNVIKHANATKATIQFALHTDVFNFSIEDNGIGFNPEVASEGLGLNSIKNRLKKIGASMDVDSKIGQGTSILVNVPL